MALRRFHFLNPMIHSQIHILKGWPGHRLVKIGLATRPSIAKWQFQNSCLFFLGVWVKLVALRKTLMSTKACFCNASVGKRSLGKPATITFSENKDVNSWIKFRLLYDNSLASALGGSCAMGTNTMALIQTCQIQAIMTVPHRLRFSAQLSNCNLATCWHIELSILGLLHLSISIHLGNSFSCSMKFFQLKITLGLALGESWPLLAQPQKNTDVHKGILLWGKLS